LSSQRRITVVVEAEKDGRDFLRRALTNSGISFVQEPEAPDTPLKLYIPELAAAVLTLLHAINMRSGVSATIMLQDGRTFKSDEEGQRALLEATTAAMNAQQAPGVQLFPWWTEFIPEVKGILKQISELIGWYPKAVGEAEARVTKYFIGLLSFIIAGTFVLAYAKILSGDTFALLVGAVVGYIFAFLTKFLGLSGGGD
jgi:hypothetical protein